MPDFYTLVAKCSQFHLQQIAIDPEICRWLDNQAAQKKVEPPKKA